MVHFYCTFALSNNQLNCFVCVGAEARERDVEGVYLEREREREINNCQILSRQIIIEQTSVDYLLIAACDSVQVESRTILHSESVCILGKCVNHHI